MINLYLTNSAQSLQTTQLHNEDWDEYSYHFSEPVHEVFSYVRRKCLPASTRVLPDDMDPFLSSPYRQNRKAILGRRFGSLVPICNIILQAKHSVN